MVMTIPKGTLFPMCGMNLAFDRDLIGPAMYFGLMGDGQPIGRYDDMWAGWCCKVSSKLLKTRNMPKKKKKKRKEKKTLAIYIQA